MYISREEVHDTQPVSFSEAVSIAVHQGLIDSKNERPNEKKVCFIQFTKRKNNV